MKNVSFSKEEKIIIAVIAVYFVLVIASAIFCLYFIVCISSTFDNEPGSWHFLKSGVLFLKHHIFISIWLCAPLASAIPLAICWENTEKKYKR